MEYWGSKMSESSIFPDINFSKQFPNATVLKRSIIENTRQQSFAGILPLMLNVCLKKGVKIYGTDIILESANSQPGG